MDARQHGDRLAGVDLDDRGANEGDPDVGLAGSDLRQSADTCSCLELNDGKALRPEEVLGHQLGRGADDGGCADADHAGLRR